MAEEAAYPAMLAAAVGLAHQLVAMGGGDHLRQLVVDHDGIHGMSERSGWVALSAGPHFFELTYFQGCCGIGLTLQVQAPLGARGPLPSGWLFHQDPHRRRDSPRGGAATVARGAAGRSVRLGA